MPQLIKLADLQARRRMLNLPLRKIADQTGLTLSTVWNCLHFRCSDARKIILVCKAIGVSPNRLDWETFVLGDPKNSLNVAQNPNDQIAAQACPPGRCRLAEKATETANGATAEG